jgi:PAS domain S-box-containing protein
MILADLDLTSGAMALLAAFVLVDLVVGERLGPAGRRRLRLGSLVALMTLTLGYPTDLGNGIIVDTRGAMVAAAFVLLGFVPALVVTGVGIALRLVIGGEGASAGVIGLVLDLALVVGAVTATRRLRWNRYAVVLAAGVAAGIGEATSLLFIPDVGRDVFDDTAGALFLAQVVGTLGIVVLAWLTDDRRDESDTKNRLAESLVESERRYRLLAENSADVISVLAVGTWRFSYVSPSVLLQTGFTVDQMLGMRIDQAVDPAFASLAIPALEARITAFEAGDESQRIEVIETRLAHQTLGSFVAEVVTTLLTDDAGRVTQVLSVTRDITQRRRAEADLRASEVRFRAVFDQMTVGVIHQDATGRVVMANPAAREMLGHLPAQIPRDAADAITLRREDGSVLPDDERPGRRALASGRIVRDQVIGFDVPGQHEITWVRATAVPLRGVGGLHLGGYSRDGDGEVVTLLTDITAERATQADLRLKEAAMASAAIGIGIVGGDGTFSYANQAMLGLWHFASWDEARRHRVSSMWQDRVVMGDIRQRIKMGRSWSGRLVAVRPDETTFVAELAASPIVGPTGDLVSVMISMTDVTERIALEEELRVERDRLSTASRAGRVTMWDWDLATNTMTVTGYVDPGITRLAPGGTVPAELFLDAVHPEDRPVLFHLITDHISGGAPYVQEYRIRRDDGTWIWWRVIGASVTESDTVVRLTGACRDITAEREATLALEATAQRLERAQEVAKLGSWEMDVPARRLEWSAETYRIFEIEPTSTPLTPDAFLDLVPEDERDEVTARFDAYIRSGERFEIEHRVVLPSGAVKWIRQSGVTDHSDNGNPVRIHGTAQDITEHRRAQDAERLQEEKELAEEANRAKSDFLASMSHEIRTPMTAVLGFAQLLGEDTTLTAENREYVDRIVRSGEHLLHLIDDVLQMSKIEAGRLTLNPVDTDLDALVQDLRTLFDLRARERGVDLRLERDDRVPRSILVDPLRLRQVLINLLGNAVKFTAEGSICVRISGSGDVEPDGSFEAVFTVTDTGRGIAPEEIGGVFDRFEQTESGREVNAGTGLGLPISKGLAQLMGGDITVESTPGVGTTFRVTIRTRPASTAGAGSTATTASAPVEVDGTGYVVLVADDAPENRMVLGVMLRSAGFTVEMANDGLEAVEKFPECHPDLVIMDLQMPRLDGIEAMRRLRTMEGGDRVRIVAATANVFEDDRHHVLEAGGDGFIPKPFTKAQLLTTVAEQLRLTPSSRPGPVDAPPNDGTAPGPTSLVGT